MKRDNVCKIHRETCSLWTLKKLLRSNVYNNWDLISLMEKNDF